MASDYEKLLPVLVNGQVKFVLVGGVAAVVHGSARPRLIWMWFMREMRKHQTCAMCFECETFLGFSPHPFFLPPYGRQNAR